jgi:hypothetical protein
VPQRPPQPLVLQGPQRVVGDPLDRVVGGRGGCAVLHVGLLPQASSVGKIGGALGARLSRFQAR